MSGDLMDRHHGGGNFVGRVTVRCVGFALVLSLLAAGSVAYDLWWKDDVGVALEARLADLVLAPQNRAVLRTFGSRDTRAH